MEHFEGELLIGKIVKVKPYALFLEFEDNSQGLLHISEISDNFIRDIEKYGTYGDLLKVVVISIDSKNGFMRVSYKKVPKEESYNSHEANTKEILNQSTDEFLTLKEKLPQWIENTLKEGNKDENSNK